MSKIRYRILKDWKDREGKAVYSEGEFVELEHDEAAPLVNRGILTRQGAGIAGEARGSEKKDL